jgi:hypothetical protein
MSARFRWDRVKEARIHQFYNLIEVKRGALLTGVDQTLPEQVILHGLTEAGAPAIGDSYDSDNPNLQCCEIDVTGEASTVHGASLNLVVTFNNHLVDGIAWPSDAWYVQDSTTTSLEETQLDANNKPLKVVYELGNSSTQQYDYPKLQKFMPLRTLTIQRLINGRPNNAYLAAIACVNDRMWQGYPKGYWICGAVGATANSRFPQFTELSFTFLNRVTRDWSSYAVFEDETGRAPSDLDPDDIKEVVDGEYGIGQDNNANGFLAVGLYPEVNMFSIFGI